jgi:hypothetical protein
MKTIAETIKLLRVTAIGVAFFMLLSMVPPALAADISVVPLWDGETVDCLGLEDNRLLNRYGGNPIAGITATVQYVTNTVHSGRGAFRVDLNRQVPSGGYDCVGTALSGFGPSTAYIDTRDISRFRQIRMWLKNETGSTYSFVLESKDYRDSDDHRGRLGFTIGPGSSWTEIVAPLPVHATNGWTVVGNPDFSRTKLLAFVIEANWGVVVGGSIFLDDLVLIERGPALDPQTAPIRDLVERLASRQFDALWGMRDRTTGVLPTISAYADVVALNVTAMLVNLLPTALDRAWISQSQADDYVLRVVGSLNTAMDIARSNYSGGYLPPRYMDRLSLNPSYVMEESPADAAFMFLALYQYKSLPSAAPAVRSAIQSLLNRFNFAAFASPQGWKLAFDYDLDENIPGLQPGLAPGTYDGYSGEIWTISLAAHLAVSNHVDIVTLYHSGVYRTNSFLVDPARAHLVHSLPEFRAPFLQWLFPLFVNVSQRGRDSFPNPGLASNPLENAINYQQEVHAKLALLGRPFFLQPDAGDNGGCCTSCYQQYSLYHDFGQPDLFMPWSVAFSFLGETALAEAALRHLLAHNLHGPLGLADSVRWPTGQVEPDSVAARQDLWNTALSEMAFVQYLYGASDGLTSLPEVSRALAKVFLPRLTVVLAGGDIVISWPTNAAGYLLQSNANLSTTNGWTTVTNLPAIVMDKAVVTNAISDRFGFYRLSQ